MAALLYVIAAFAGGQALFGDNSRAVFSFEIPSYSIGDNPLVRGLTSVSHLRQRAFGQEVKGGYDCEFAPKKKISITVNRDSCFFLGKLDYNYSARSRSTDAPLPSNASQNCVLAKALQAHLSAEQQDELLNAFLRFKHLRSAYDSSSGSTNNVEYVRHFYFSNASSLTDIVADMEVVLENEEYTVLKVSLRGRGEVKHYKIPVAGTSRRLARVEVMSEEEVRRLAGVEVVSEGEVEGVLAEEDGTTRTEDMLSGQDLAEDGTTRTEGMLSGQDLAEDGTTRNEDMLSGKDDSFLAARSSGAEESGEALCGAQSGEAPVEAGEVAKP